MGNIYNSKRRKSSPDVLRPLRTLLESKRGLFLRDTFP